jgi:hypothetical protein
MAAGHGGTGKDETAARIVTPAAHHRDPSLATEFD